MLTNRDHLECVLRIPRITPVCLSVGWGGGGGTRLVTNGGSIPLSLSLSSAILIAPAESTGDETNKCSCPTSKCGEAPTWRRTLTSAINNPYPRQRSATPDYRLGKGGSDNCSIRRKILSSDSSVTCTCQRYYNRKLKNVKCVFPFVKVTRSVNDSDDNVISGFRRKGGGERDRGGKSNLVQSSFNGAAWINKKILKKLRVVLFGSFFRWKL